MFGLTNRKRAEPVADTSPAPGYELERRIRALELGLDDMVDQFRRFRGRIIKRMADDYREQEAHGDNGAGEQRPSIAQLKASGRWPLR